MRLDEPLPVVEPDQLRIGSRGQRVADIPMRQRVERLGHRRQLIAPDLGRRPQRDVIGRGRCWDQHAVLLGLKVLPGPALRPTMPALPILLETPVPRVGARVLDRGEHFARKAVIADARYGALHAGLVSRGAHAGRIDVKLPRLRVLAKCRRDAGAERIGIENDGLRVIGDQDGEDPAKERPRGFARLDRAGGGFLERRVHEAMPRAHGGEDPRAKPTTLPRDLREREPPHPGGVDLQLLPRRPIEDRDRRRRAAKVQLQDGEPMERRVRNDDGLPRQEFANLREAQSVLQPPFDGRALGHTMRPAVATRAPTARMQRQQDVAELLVRDGRRPHRHAHRRRDGEIAPDRLRIEAELRGESLLGHALAP